MFDTRLTPRPKGPPIWVKAIPIVCALGLGVAGVVFLGIKADDAATARQEKDAQNQRLALQEMRSSFDSLAHSKPGGQVDTQVRATGEAGEVEGAMKHLVEIVAANRDNYHAELVGLGYPGFLAPGALQNEDLRAVHAKLLRAEAIEQKYRALNEGLSDAYHDWVNKSAITDAHKAQLLSSFDRGWQNGAAVRQQLWDEEGQILGQYDGMVVLLSHTRGAWRAQGHKIEFTDPAVLRAYNGYIMNVRALASAQAELKHRDENTMDQQLDAQISETN
jgi:hypothetical protein